jgi:Family of unknown function (DUF6069)
MSTTKDSSHTGLATKAAVRTGGLAIIIAAVANSVVGIGADAAGVAMEVKGFGSKIRESIPFFAYFVSTALGGAVGILLMLLMKKVGIKKKTFLIVTGVLTLLSLISPLTANASIGTKVVLEVLHIIAAVIIIPALAKGLTN